MYDVHQKQISDFARSTPERFAHTLGFVLCTIRQPLHIAALQAAMLRSKNGYERVRPLFAFKMRAYSYVWKNRRALHANAELLYKAGNMDALLDYFTQLHGYGLAKAGFACQLIYGVSGCIDGHNLRRFDISHLPRVPPGVLPATRRAHCIAYNALIARCGGTAELWNGWCGYVHARNPRRYDSPAHVSAYHALALGLSAIWDRVQGALPIVDTSDVIANALGHPLDLG